MSTIKHRNPCLDLVAEKAVPSVMENLSGDVSLPAVDACAVLWASGLCHVVLSRVVLCMCQARETFASLFLLLGRYTGQRICVSLDLSKGFLLFFEIHLFNITFYICRWFLY